MREIKLSGPAHPITVEPAIGRLVVRAVNASIVDTHAALLLREASYPPVYYSPRVDVDMSLLVLSDHKTYCPYKGECSYYSVMNGGQKSINAAWSYELPHPAMLAIKGYLAFYENRVDSISKE